ncbi:unnamed protein product [Acanthoscelides obtectus]|uniref:Uncharacterized protein n=1 Tax=Acanthoscelides obtectus TaxID=200917 RepID=A0A9P0JXT8_ACAOB|nr:unnamed protein product [Acanthoscelides obtectus]CAK1647103.1 hypothetical protein AOBTE_LOCUS15048 [Acanthoscelides obtectus]
MNRFQNWKIQSGLEILVFLWILQKS